MGRIFSTREALVAQGLLNAFLGLWLYFEYASNLYMQTYVQQILAVYSLPIAILLSAGITIMAVRVLKGTRVGRSIIGESGPGILKTLFGGGSQGSQGGSMVGQSADEASLTLQTIAEKKGEPVLPALTAQSLESELLEQVRRMKARIAELESATRTNTSTA